MNLHPSRSFAMFAKARKTLSLTRFYHGSKLPLTVGIRREDPLRVWERRCPLTPDLVRTLIKDHSVNVLIQPCERRVYTLDQFIKAGAQAHATLDPAHIILGIKEVPTNELLVNPVECPIGGFDNTPDSPTEFVPRTYLMFSHTVKGQMYNMPLLARFLNPQPMHPDVKLHQVSGESESDKLPTLIDYELLTDANGKRTVGFGWYAGVAGALEGLISTAHLYLELGIATPFLHTPRPHTASVSSLRSSLQGIGKSIATIGMPRSVGPFIIGITGTGQVSHGALSLLSELPIQFITVDNLPSLVSDLDVPLNKIYVLHATPDTYLNRKDGRAYSRVDYYANPSEYESRFHKTIAPYLTLLINGVGWSPSFPRLMTNRQLVEALETVQCLQQRISGLTSGSGIITTEVMKGRCRSFADISCDVEGGLEFLPRTSTLSEPFFAYRPPNLPSHLPSLQIMSVDILPTALPLDASEAFSTGIMPYLKALIRQYRSDAKKTSLLNYNRDFEHEEIIGALNRATIASGGALSEKCRWLQTPLGQWRVTSPSLPISSMLSYKNVPMPLKKKVLLLGSGMVSLPAVDEMCKRKDVHVIVASNNVRDNDVLTHTHSNATSVKIDVGDIEALDTLIQKADVVTSLLPAYFHPVVADLCIKQGKSMVTASYISLPMKALHDRAMSANVLLLNEIGLDPGIDHCSALSLLSHLRQQNKKVVSFVSFCGGLPAPEHSDVPLGYKFSWSPQGVLRAALNSAHFRLGGKEFEIPSESLLQSKFPDIPVSPVLKLEGFANRDSIPYAESYGLGPAKDLRTLLRGTLRYPGFCDLMHAFKEIGLLETQKHIRLDHWSSLASHSLALRLGTPITDQTSFYAALTDAVQPHLHAMLLEALDRLAIFPNNTEPEMPKPPTSSLPPIDFFTMLLSYKLCYQSNEKDMVILHHEVISQTCPPAGPALEEVHVSSLHVYGTSRASAMSRCVGLPVAFATLKVMDGGVHIKGVQGPTDPVIYSHVLDCLDEGGLQMKNSQWENRCYGGDKIGIERHLREHADVL